MQESLHPVIETHVGDWILYKDYTIIRVYGSKKNPYRLIFLTPRIFTLEILWQRFDSDYIHFSKQNQAACFKPPITIGPFTTKNRSIDQLIEDMLTFFKFERDASCQYDPVGVIHEKRRKLKRGTYEHKGTSKMNKLENKFVYSDEEKDSKEVEVMEIKILIEEEAKGKRPMKQDGAKGSNEKKKVKEPKLSTTPLLQIVEHNQAIIESRSIIQNYAELEEKEMEKGKMKDA